jgi:hypothetical protein
MLQIIALYFLCRNCSRLAESKGHRGGVYGFFAGAMTIGLELIFVVLGYFLLGEYITFYELFFAYFGAGLGALIGWLVANNLENKPYEEPPRAMMPRVVPTPVMTSVPYAPKEPVWCLQCGKKLPAGTVACDDCGTKVPTLD